MRRERFHRSRRVHRARASGSFGAARRARALRRRRRGDGFRPRRCGGRLAAAAEGRGRGDQRGGNAVFRTPAPHPGADADGAVRGVRACRRASRDPDLRPGRGGGCAERVPAHQVRSRPCAGRLQRRVDDPAPVPGRRPRRGEQPLVPRARLAAAGAAAGRRRPDGPAGGAGRRGAGRAAQPHLHAGPAHGGRGRRARPHLAPDARSLSRADARGTGLLAVHPDRADARGAAARAAHAPAARQRRHVAHAGGERAGQRAGDGAAARARAATVRHRVRRSRCAARR